MTETCQLCGVTYTHWPSHARTLGHLFARLVKRIAHLA